MNPTDLVTAAAAAQEPLDPSTLADVGAWVVASIRDLEFALECIGESRAEMDSIDAQQADAFARIKARADMLKEKALRRVTYFEGRAAEYLEAHRSEILIGKKKSREFIGGKVAWRAKGGRLIVTNKDELAAWLTTQDDPTLMRVTVAPDMKALQDMAHTKGIVPPGTDWDPERDELHIESVPLPTLPSTPNKVLP